MKKIIALALALILSLSLASVAFAAIDPTDVCAIGDEGYATVADAVTAAAEGDTVKLLANITGTATITVNKDLTLDLNGKTIENTNNDAWVLKVDGNSTLTLTDSSEDANGEIKGWRGISIAKGSELIMNGGNVVATKQGIQVYGSSATMNGGSITSLEPTNAPKSGGVGAVMLYSNGDARGTFTMNGGKLVSAGVAVYPNGSDEWDDCDATITGGEIVCETAAIYWPANGKLTITGGTITGTTGVYVKSGSLEITGGELKATGDKVEYDFVNSGLKDTGDALVIENVAKGGYQSVTSVSVTGGTFESENGNAVASYAAKDQNPAVEAVDNFISGGSFSEDVTEFLAEDVVLNENGTVIDIVNPGNTIVVDDDIDRTVYKVKGYDFTSSYVVDENGVKVETGYQGASYIDEIKIDKNNDLIIVLKDNYKLATDKNIKGVIYLVNKSDRNDTAEIPVEYNVKNNVVETYGEKKAKDAIEVPEGENTVILMDEDGGYVYFEEEMLKGVVKMNAEEKTFLNVIYGGQEETVEAIEEVLGEEYLDEAIIEYYEFETRAFKNEVAFSYEAYEDDPHYFYLYNDGKLTKIDATYNDDEEVEAWEWTAIAEGTIIVTDVEIVLAAEENSKNPDTGASDVVGVASALAVVSLVAAGAISLKK